MVATTRQAVAPVPVQPPRYGLLVAAAVSPMNGVRWQQGVRWNPEQCGVSGRASVECFGDYASPVEAERSGNIVDADPFAVFAHDECSPFGFQARDWSGRALRQLEATQSYEIANEFWTGELHLSDGLEGGFLTDHSTLEFSFQADNVIDALGCVEQGLASCGKGRRGMIHVTPQALAHLTTNNTVRIEGTQYLSPLGNIVVADAGYDGSGPGGAPAGATQWMYGTGIIAVTLESQATLVPGRIEEAQAMAQSLNRADNTLTVRAEKLAMYQWDRCCHVGVEFDLPVCVVGS